MICRWWLELTGGETSTLGLVASLCFVRFPTEKQVKNPGARILSCHSNINRLRAADNRVTSRLCLTGRPGRNWQSGVVDINECPDNDRKSSLLATTSSTAIKALAGGLQKVVKSCLLIRVTLAPWMQWTVPAEGRKRIERSAPQTLVRLRLRPRHNRLRMASKTWREKPITGRKKTTAVLARTNAVRVVFPVSCVPWLS